MLALAGEKDAQVNAMKEVPAIEQALRTGGNEDATARVLPKLNHLFQRCKRGGRAEYENIEVAIDPIVLDEITSWLSKKTRTLTG